LDVLDLLSESTNHGKVRMLSTCMARFAADNSRKSHAGVDDACEKNLETAQSALFDSHAGSVRTTKCRGSMVSLKLQKRLASSVLKCGARKIWMDPNEVRPSGRRAHLKLKFPRNTARRLATGVQRRARRDFSRTYTCHAITCSMRTRLVE